MSTVTKGKGYEREIRRVLLDNGFPARRTPRSGATDFAKGDVQFTKTPFSNGQLAEHAAGDADWWCEAYWTSDKKLRKTYTVECKRRKVPTWLKECLEHDVVCIREDRGETIVVMDLDTLLELMK